MRHNFKGTTLNCISSTLKPRTMKNALMAVVIMAFAYTNAEAQINCTVVSKKKVVTTSASTANTCKLVPKNVCTISPDRRSVTCYKSVDPQHFERYGTQTSYYGPSGAVPGQKARFETATVVIKDDEKTDYCVRDNVNRATYCYYSGYRICRDANGYYSMCTTPENNLDNRTSTAKTRKPKNSGNNGVVLK